MPRLWRGIEFTERNAMTYIVKNIDDYSSDYSIHVGKIPGDIRDKTTTESTTHSIEVFKDVVKELVDPTDYELTEENVKKEFPYFTPDGIKTVMNYYGVRNRIWKDMEKWIEENKDSNEPVYFHFDFPEETNWFSVDGNSKEHPEKQHESSIQLEINP